MPQSTEPPWFLRKIDSADPWRKAANLSSDLPSACLRDLADKDSCPSLYEIRNDADIVVAVAGIAAGSQSNTPAPATVMILSNSCVRASGLVPVSTPATVDAVRDKHWQLTDLSVGGLSQWVVAIHGEVSGGAESEGSFEQPGLREISRPEIADQLIRWIAEGSLKVDLKREKALAECASPVGNTILRDLRNPVQTGATTHGQ